MSSNHRRRRSAFKAMERGDFEGRKFGKFHRPLKPPPRPTKAQLRQLADAKREDDDA